MQLARLARRAYPAARTADLNNFEAEVRDLIRSEVLRVSASVIDGMNVYDRRLETLHAQADHLSRQITLEEDRIDKREADIAERLSQQHAQSMSAIRDCLHHQTKVLKLTCELQPSSRTHALLQRLRTLIKRASPQ